MRKGGTSFLGVVFGKRSLFIASSFMLACGVCLADPSDEDRTPEHERSSAWQRAHVEHQQGLDLARDGHYNEAIAKYHKAIANYPGDFNFHYDLGNAQKWKGDVRSAEYSFRNALRVRPSDADAWTNLGLVLNRQGRYKEADAALTRAQRCNPSEHTQSVIERNLGDHR